MTEAVASAVPVAGPVDEPVVEPALAMCACGHLLVRHDAIAARYCDATLAGVLPRGCICKE